MRLELQAASWSTGTADRSRRGCSSRGDFTNFTVVGQRSSTTEGPGQRADRNVQGAGQRGHAHACAAADAETSFRMVAAA